MSNPRVHYSSSFQYATDAVANYHRHFPQFPASSVVSEWSPAASFMHGAQPLQGIAPLGLQYASQRSPSIVRGWSGATEIPHYSSASKAYYSPIPFNPQANFYEPVKGRFGISRLPQTDVLPVVEQNPRDSAALFGYNEISLGNTISPLIAKMGAIRTSSGINLGTCTLIAENLVMVARHAIEDQNIHNLKVSFGYCRSGHSTSQFAESQFDYVIEDDPRLDYAIVKLKTAPGKEMGFVPLNTTDNLLSEPALLHYPLGQPLKVSVHACDQTNYKANYLQTFHDSDYFSSGGAYFDPSGRFTAMHLGAELNRSTMNLQRYAITLKEIVAREPNSILAKLADGRLSQAESYYSHSPSYFLEGYSRDFVLDEEGYQSKRILTTLLKKQTDKSDPLYDKKISMNKSGVALEGDNLAYIEKKYPAKFKQFMDECLKVGGIHKVTKQYSVVGYIESDHTIPHDVWKSTANVKMKNLIKGGGARAGENELPTITIPYQAHRDLATTASSHVAKKFRQQLTDLCDKDQIPEALIACFKEYERGGIKLNDYKPAVIKAVEEHVRIGVITAAEEKRIIRKLKLD